MTGRRIHAAAVAAVLVLGGCAAGGSAAPAVPPPAGGAFPVVITHALGEVTVPAAPQRVVVLGVADAQIARALDAPIVGATANSFGATPNYPGVDPPLDLSVITLAPTEPDLEKIAALRPDLILATTAQPAYHEVYAELSAIAPTVAYRSGLLEDSGEELVEIVATALGASATDLIAESEERIGSFAAAHPELAGSTFAYGQHAAGNTFLVVAPEAPSAGFLARLGMRLPAELAALPVQQAPGVTAIAPENLGLLDTADVALIGTPEPDRAAFAALPLVAGLDLARDGRLHLLSIDQTSLLLAPNPATTGAVLDMLEPYLDPTGG